MSHPNWSSNKHHRSTEKKRSECEFNHVARERDFVWRLKDAGVPAGQRLIDNLSADYRWFASLAHWFQPIGDHYKYDRGLWMRTARCFLSVTSFQLGHTSKNTHRIQLCQIIRNRLANRCSRLKHIDTFLNTRRSQQRSPSRRLY